MARGRQSFRRRVLALAGLATLTVLAVSIGHGVRANLGARSGAQADPSSYVIAAAGDIACPAEAEIRSPTEVPTTDTGVPAKPRPAYKCAARATADLLGEIDPVAVLPLGDLQYQCGAEADFMGSYVATWGQFRPISRPVVGNHEYGNGCGRNDITGYVTYFGEESTGGYKGWYSFDVGDWHLIALNSQCSYGEGIRAVGGCQAVSEQRAWLQADLAAHPNACTLAYWHEPRFSSGQHGAARQMAHIWNDLVTAHVDVVLSAHNHVYERFDLIGHTEAPPREARSPVLQQPNLDPKGIQEFVVGTGGKNHYRFSSRPLIGESVRNDSTFGVLSLTLKRDSYDWEFRPIKGADFRDSGSATCR